MRNPIAITTLTLFLIGCSTTPPFNVVNIPIPIKPTPPSAIQRPYLPILDINITTIEACEETGDLCGDLVKALDASLEAAMAWGRQMEIVLDGYRSK